MVRITGTDEYGDAIARPAEWDTTNGPPPLILMQPERPGAPALAPGDRVLARLTPIGHGRYEGRTMQRVGEAPSRILGVFKPARHESRI
ncbi:MAG TPA: ribonuclease R, partial [Rhodopila sp.]|nr:ribonuclease R [Rhodopila sp.]